jgi:molybdopterin-dependent oxidoreductase-like protein protein
LHRTLFYTKIIDAMQDDATSTVDFSRFVRSAPHRRRGALTRGAACAAVAAMALGQIARPQAQAPAAGAAAVLAVGGDVPHALSLTPSDIKAMPRTTVTVSEEGRDITYEGVLVGEVLKRAGAPVGRDMTGQAVASYVLAKARDGYQVVFSLPELDPAFTANDIIVADTIGGKPLFDYQGPFRIVAPHDKRGARSIRMLQSIDLVRLPR